MRARFVTVVGLSLMLACSPGGSTTSSSVVEQSATTETDGQEAGTDLLGDVPVIAIVGPPKSGAGEVPVFSWSPVEGAVVYDLVVVGPDGPIWAWRGSETEVALGGLSIERPPGLGGPVVTRGSCWSVLALDAAGHVVAISQFLPVSPDDSSGQCTPGQIGSPA